MAGGEAQVAVTLHSQWLLAIKNISGSLNAI